ncbi:ABC-type bacteriocin/lantibiotic exporter with N-terminal double-glycine peptidase domain [Nostoc sp. PCC 7524]|uniref:ABC transporter ATP-binding protein n=1 Tax=Nostoc sp. (strain ATCC 29411 / PCC 7524) TaxID=28072 RepID=UPI00029F427F|nr:ABC transporter transmembrane domain-containing protein [Nostoc sp. PCC 7524]AFY51202.1 ABC-type bacteriocin/lantibiotic exporter with N-terminal double-glycine peptidase domain [Nostoc sp. PCC 7524]
MAIGSKFHRVLKRRRHSRHPLQRLLDYGYQYRHQIWLATGCSVLNKIFDLAPPALIGIAVDVVVKQQDSIIAQLGVKYIFGQFLIISLLTVITWILESFFEYRYQLFWRNLAQSIQHNLRLDAYKHLQDLELAYFEERSTGGLMSILSDDVNQLERFLDVGANDIIQVITTIVVIGGAFFVLAPSVAWMALLPMPLILLGSVAFQKLLAPRYADVREKVGLLNGRLSNNLSGITTIKSFTAEEYEIKRLEQDSLADRHSNTKAIALSAAFIPLIRMLILAGFTALLLFGGLETVAGRMSVGDLKLQDLRRSIGLVSQDVFLFHGTVAENIAYGSFDATQEEIITAAKIAEAHEFISRLPQGYETIVGERGQKLSGGQRQRIAIARAVLKNPPILILDEATSVVDNETEAAIGRSLERITVDRTTIAIAHRLSTICHADCIYVMEHGQLVESGTHEELLEQAGIYASLWRMQSGMR